MENNFEPVLDDFSDIEDNYLRAYNRLVVMFNLNEEGLSSQATDYAKQFSEVDRLSIAVVTAEIRDKGWKFVTDKIRARLSSKELVDGIQEEVTLH